MKQAEPPLLLLATLGRSIYALTTKGQTAWRLRTDGPVYALTVLDDGHGIAGDDAGMVTAFDKTGRRLWERDLGSRVTVLSDKWQGGVLAGSWEMGVTFLTDDGELHWQVALDGPASGIATVPRLGVVATLNGAVLALDPTGSEMWRFDAGVPVAAIGTLGSGDDANLLVSLQDGRLAALGQDGSLLWQQTFGAGGPVWQVVNGGQETPRQIVVGSGGQQPSVALLSANGQSLWRVALPAAVGALTCLDVDSDGPQEILVGLTTGQILAFDSEGRLRGSAHGGLSVWDMIPFEEGSALVLADVVAWQLNSSTGHAGGPWLSPPAMAPAPQAPFSQAVERGRDEIILVFLGDVGLGRSMERQLARFGSSHPWEGIGPVLSEADLAVANLEGLLTTRGKPLDKSYLIRAHPSWGQSLVDGSLDLVSLANNHALDFGPGGLDETVASLEALDIAVVGAGASRESAHLPALFDLEGVRVAILGYAASRWNGSVDMPATDRVAWAESVAVQADVQAVRDRADLVVVLLHAGTEYASAPSSDQVAIAHAAIDAGADLVVGHHPHVTQTFEQYKHGLIVFSLGDALFDIPRQAAMQGDMLRVHATRDGLTRAELWPFWIEEAIRPRLLEDGAGQPRFRIIYP